MKEIQRAKAALFQPQCNAELHREPVREWEKSRIGACHYPALNSMLCLAQLQVQGRDTTAEEKKRKEKSVQVKDSHGVLWTEEFSQAEHKAPRTEK